MRMWMVDPQILCRKHLLGEHVECHMFVGTILRGKNLVGYVDNNLLELKSLRKRHKALRKEMLRRGYNHQSKLKPYEHLLSSYPKKVRSSLVNVDSSLKDLLSRCPICRKRFRRLYGLCSDSCTHD